MLGYTEQGPEIQERDVCTFQGEVLLPLDHSASSSPPVCMHVYRTQWTSRQGGEGRKCPNMCG